MGAAEVRDLIDKADVVGDGKKKRESQATVLINLASECGCEFFHDGQECYATIPINDHLETWNLGSRGFKRWLARLFFGITGAAANAEAINTAVTTLAGIALFEGAERKVYVRIAGDDRRVYLDLADAAWRVVEIDAGGWRIKASRACGARFQRPEGMEPLPEPKRGGKIDQLRPFINVTDDDFMIAVAWLVMAFRPSGPYPILNYEGEQGSAKTTGSRGLRALCDPNFSPLRRPPRTPDDLMIAARNGWVIAFDNLSNLPAWLSDDLCRLATGAALSTRTLYTNSEETLFRAQRPCLFNGIGDVATRPDLLDRVLSISAPKILEGKRRNETEFWEKFRLAEPAILGALMEGVSCALRNRSSLKSEDLPRMADFASWVEAAAPAFGWKPGQFLSTYAENRRVVNELPLQTPLVDALRKLSLPWEGTATELLAELEAVTDERVRRSKKWPGIANALSNALRRIATNLRSSGIELEFILDKKRGHSRLIRMTALPVKPQAPETVAGRNGHFTEPETERTEEVREYDID
jgi:hypothetical protein